MVFHCVEKKTASKKRQIPTGGKKREINFNFRDKKSITTLLESKGNGKAKSHLSSMIPQLIGGLWSLKPSPIVPKHPLFFREKQQSTIPTFLAPERKGGFGKEKKKQRRESKRRKPL